MFYTSYYKKESFYQIQRNVVKILVQQIKIS